MPIYPNFDNTVMLVEGSPIEVADCNAMIATMNAAGYWFTDMKFVNSGNALMLFCKQDPIFGYEQEQKINEVDYTQAALDADKAAEIVNGFWPTGIFIRPISDEDDPTPFIHYQRLDELPT